MRRDNVGGEKGFTIVEALVVAGIIMMLAALAAGISSKAFSRRDADRTTTGISSELQLMRLSALRRGVEYRVRVEFEPGCREGGEFAGRCHFVAVTSSMGNSNRGSTAFSDVDTTVINVNRNLTVTPSALTLTFQPNGMVPEGGGNIIVAPIEEAFERKLARRCGSITVDGFGRIVVVQGNWRPDDGTCLPIREVNEEG
jgi:Tfp pilus assembly protein FimT